MSAAKSLLLYYLTFSRSLLSPLTSPTKTTVLSDVMSSDDSPFSTVQLSTNFNFAGEDTSFVYVSPNGAIHLKKDQPCFPYSTFGTTGICDFNTSYYGVIGGYLTDLDPFRSTNVNITAEYYTDRTKINYKNVEYYGSNLANTFSVSLHDDDHITLEYTSISKNATANLPYKKGWISGLRPPRNSSVYIDSTNTVISSAEWHTSIAGFYPDSKSAVTTGKAFILCPVSLSWCLRNGTRSLSELQTSSSSATGASIQLVTAKLSCVDDIDYGVSLSYSSSGVIRSWNTNCTSSFHRTVNRTNDGYGVLSCSLSTDFVSSLSTYLGASSTKSVNVTVRWRSIKNNVLAWKSLPLSTTTLQVSTSSSVSPTCRCSVAPVFGTGCRSLTNYSTSPCAGDFSCAASGNICYKAQYPRSLFQQSDCRGNCPSLTHTTAANQTYIEDSDGVCCAVGSLDCAGYCSGGNRVAYASSSDTSRYCCAAKKFPVDCDGVCGGAKVKTSCGYCVSSSQSGQCAAVRNTLTLSRTNATGVYYISFSAKAAAVASRLSGVTTVPATLRRLLKSDDTPHALVTLPRPFVFNGRVTNRIFVSPNGALHFTKQMPCHPDGTYPYPSSSTQSTCTMNTAFYDTIAGYLNDLNPSSSLCTGVNLTMTTFTDHVDFNFIGFCYLYPLALRNTFTISLYDDDRIITSYQSLYQSKIGITLPATNAWIVGIRPPKQNNVVLLDATQRSVSTNEWKTTLAGVYPTTQASVTTGNAFVVCPTTMVWCLRHSLRSDDVWRQSPIIELVTAKISCLREVRYGVIYSWSATHRMSSSMFVSCNASRVTSDGGYGLLRCRIPTTEVASRLTSNGGAVAMHFWVQWQTRNTSSTAWTALPMSPVTLTIVDNTTVLPITPATSCDCNVDSFGCGTGRVSITTTNRVNNASVVIVNARNVSYAQSMCAGNFSCFNRPCYTSPSSVVSSSSSSVNVPVARLFLDRDCTDNCSISLTSAGLYTEDRNGRCCSVDSGLDCAGLCYSNSSIAVNSDGSEVCCAPGIKIDCAGVCGGGRVINVCGTCTATDPNGNACFASSQLSVTTLYRKDTTSLYPVYDLSSFRTMDTTEILQLRNNAKMPVTVTVAMANANDPLAPLVTLPVNATQLNVGERKNITLPTSVASLYNGTITQWGYRTIVLTFYRTSVPSPAYARIVYLYPVVKSCGHLSDDRATCMRMPGCFFCLEYPSQYFVTTEKIEIRIRRTTSRRRRRLAATATDATGESDVSATEDGDASAEVDGSGADVAEGDEAEDWDYVDGEEALEETDDGGDTNNDPASARRRRLFSGFVPTTLSYLTVNQREDLTIGTCVDGWRAEHCKLARSNARAANNGTPLAVDKVVHYLGNSRTSAASATASFTSTAASLFRLVTTTMASIAIACVALHYATAMPA